MVTIKFNTWGDTTPPAKGVEISKQLIHENKALRGPTFAPTYMIERGRGEWLMFLELSVIIVVPNGESSRVGPIGI